MKAETPHGRIVAHLGRDGWCLRAVGGPDETAGGLGAVPGWEDVTFTSYSQARQAVTFVEMTGGTYKGWIELKRRVKDLLEPVSNALADLPEELDLGEDPNDL